MTDEGPLNDTDTTSKIIEGILQLKKELLRMKKQQTELSFESLGKVTTKAIHD